MANPFLPDKEPENTSECHLSEPQKRHKKIPGGHEPHQSLAGLYPGELYALSAREYRPHAHPEYPFHDRTILVTHCGRICIGKRNISLRRVFAGRYVGVTEIADDIWLVSFVDYDLDALITR
jgi:hypothetical protein